MLAPTCHCAPSSAFRTAYSSLPPFQASVPSFHQQFAKGGVPEQFEEWGEYGDYGDNQPKLPKVRGGYTFTQALGEGTSGKVYSATSSVGNLVAVKVIRCVPLRYMRVIDYDLHCPDMHTVITSARANPRASPKQLIDCSLFHPVKMMMFSLERCQLKNPHFALNFPHALRFPWLISPRPSRALLAPLARCSSNFAVAVCSS